MHMAAGEHLPPGQLAVRREHFDEHPAGALQRQFGADGPSSPSGVDRRGQTPHGPADDGQLGLPALDQLPSTPCSLAWRVARAATARAW